MKAVQLFLVILLILICCENGSAQQSNILPTLNIESVQPMFDPNSPQLFTISGSATLPEGRRKDSNSVVVYTQSGGNIHLQQTEVSSEIEKKKIPRHVILDELNFDKISGGYKFNIDDIWLGKPDSNERKAYQVYTIIVRTKSREDMTRLLNTNDIFWDIRDLLQELGKRNMEPVMVPIRTIRDNTKPCK